MAFIPEGSFTMGFEIENDNEWGDMDEDPVHEVTLNAYWMDKYEVTSFDFAEFLNFHQASAGRFIDCLLYTSPSPRDRTRSRMPSSA